MIDVIGFISDIFFEFFSFLDNFIVFGSLSLLRLLIIIAIFIIIIRILKGGDKK